jgi:hypothetical protein
MIIALFRDQGQQGRDLIFGEAAVFQISRRVLAVIGCLKSGKEPLSQAKP